MSTFVWATEQEVQLVDHLGTDLTVVNAARVSFQSASEEFTDKDAALVRYLARNKHYSPFRHCMLQFRLKMPEFVARQFYKHVVGAETTSTHPTKDHAWNEQSGRYKAYCELYVPSVWNRQDARARQCSAEAFDADSLGKIDAMYRMQMIQLWKTYQDLMELGVSREQARMVLPMTFMTEVIWTASLQAVQNFVSLRLSEHAQREIRELAEKIDAIARSQFPVAYEALLSQ